MWENYIKPILKTNVVAVLWAFLLSFFIYFISTFLISFFTGVNITESEEIYKTSWYLVYEFIIGTIIAIVVNYKAAVYLYQQKVVDKIKLLNVYLLTGVIFTIIFTIFFNYYFPIEGKVMQTGSTFIVELLLFVLITKNIFNNNGKFNFKKII